MCSAQKDDPNTRISPKRAHQTAFGPGFFCHKPPRLKDLVYAINGRRVADLSEEVLNALRKNKEVVTFETYKNRQKYVYTETGEPADFIDENQKNELITTGFVITQAAYKCRQPVHALTGIKLSGAELIKAQAEGLDVAISTYKQRKYVIADGKIITYGAMKYRELVNADGAPVSFASQDEKNEAIETGAVMKKSHYSYLKSKLKKSSIDEREQQHNETHVRSTMTNG